MSSGPITPEEALARHITTIPDAVFEVVNTLLGQRAAEGESTTIYQAEVVEALVARGLDRDEIFKQRWLDFEPAYRRAGWGVAYDKPGFNETYYPERWQFTFKGRRP